MPLSPNPRQPPSRTQGRFGVFLAGIVLPAFRGSPPSLAASTTSVYWRMWLPKPLLDSDTGALEVPLSLPTASHLSSLGRPPEARGEPWWALQASQTKPRGSAAAFSTNAPQPWGSGGCLCACVCECVSVSLHACVSCVCACVSACVSLRACLCLHVCACVHACVACPCASLSVYVFACCFCVCM